MTWFSSAWVSIFFFIAACQTSGPETDMTNTVLAEGTNRAFSHTVTTDAPSEHVWQLWTDTTTWKDWDKGLKDAEIDEPFALGAKGQILPLSGPSSRFEVVEYVEGQSYAFETRLPFARLTVRRSFVSLNPTTLQHEVSFEGALAGFWASRFGPGFRAALPPTMTSLADLAEERSVEE